MDIIMFIFLTVGIALFIFFAISHFIAQNDLYRTRSSYNKDQLKIYRFYQVISIIIIIITVVYFLRQK